MAEIREPRSMESWKAAILEIHRQHNGLPVNGAIETCSIVPPRYDLGREEAPGVLVYATIDREGRQMRRVTPLNHRPDVDISAFLDMLAAFDRVHSDRPFPLE